MNEQKGLHIEGINIQRRFLKVKSLTKNVILLSSIFLINLFLFNSTDTLYSQWITGSVDTITNDNSKDCLNSPSPIAVDDENTIHVVWQKREVDNDPSSWRIYYSKKSISGNWTLPIRVSHASQTAVVPSIVIANKSNKVFVTYVNSVSYSASEIAVAIWDEKNSWQTYSIIRDFRLNLNPAIDIDGNEIVHIAWLGMDSVFKSKVKYSNNRGGIWKIFDIIDVYSGDKYYAQPSLSVSPGGYPSIVYLSFIDNAPRNVLAQSVDILGGKWEFELLPVSINGPGILKISRKGVLNYVFNYAEGFQKPSKIYHTYKSNGNWSSPILLDEFFDGICTSVELDSKEKVHVTLDSLSQSFRMGSIYYATNKTGIWEKSVVAAEGTSGLSCLKLDKNSFGHIFASSEEFPNHSEIIHFQSANNVVGIYQDTTNDFRQYRLFQNYPNPFNYSTTIPFFVEKTSTIRIRIFDIAGKVVAKLVDGRLNSGNYSIVWDARSQSSGIYFYEMVLTSEENVKIRDRRKMLYLK